MSQRCIEVVIGKLVTDEEFREKFQIDAHEALGEILERGFFLTRTEIAALLATDWTLWKRIADEIDPRLQKASLKHE